MGEIFTAYKVRTDRNTSTLPKYFYILFAFILAYLFCDCDRTFTRLEAIVCDPDL